MHLAGFSQFDSNATVRIIRVASDATPIYTVRNGKIKIGVNKKTAAILARQ
jgi:hypothetical protein